MQTKRVGDIWLIIFCLLFACTAPLHAQYRRKSCNIKIFTKGSQKDLPKIRSLFNIADLTVSRILPKKHSALIDYSIILIPKNEFKKADILSQGDNKLRFYLSADIQSWQNDEQIISNIIASLILKKSETSKGENFKVIPRWMTHALLRKIERRSRKQSIPGTISFPGIHAIVLSGTQVKWLKIVSQTPPAEDSNAYKIYMEASEIILDSILRLPGGNKVILDMIELANKDVNAKDVFVSTVTKKLYEIEKHTTFQVDDNADKQILENWLNYTFRISSVNTFTPCDATEAEKLFTKAEIVKYRAKMSDKKDAKTEERFCKIEELPDKLKEIVDLKLVILKKQRDLVRVGFSIPILLQDPVYKMQKSMDLLTTLKKDQFKKIYKAQKRLFFNALEKQNALEAYILKTEQEFVPPGYRFYAEINAEKDMEKIERARWPALTELMDKKASRKSERSLKE